MRRFIVARGLAVVSLLFAVRGALAAEPPPPPGADLYQKNCAACHDHPKDRIPPKETLAKRTPEEVVTALTTGSMRVQAGGLNLNDQIALATYLTGRAPSDNPSLPPEKNLCPRGSRFEPVTSPEGNWNGWGLDLETPVTSPSRASMRGICRSSNSNGRSAITALRFTGSRRWLADAST
jgi:hypothetical protein